MGDEGYEDINLDDNLLTNFGAADSCSKEDMESAAHVLIRGGEKWAAKALLNVWFLPKPPTTEKPTHAEIFNAAVVLHHTGHTSNSRAILKRLTSKKDLTPALVLHIARWCLTNTLPDLGRKLMAKSSHPEPDKLCEAAVYCFKNRKRELARSLLEDARNCPDSRSIIVNTFCEAIKEIYTDMENDEPSHNILIDMLRAICGMLHGGRPITTFGPLREMASLSYQMAVMPEVELFHIVSYWDLTESLLCHIVEQGKPSAKHYCRLAECLLRRDYAALLPSKFLDKAKEHCQNALKSEKRDPHIHEVLGDIHIHYIEKYRKDPDKQRTYNRHKKKALTSFDAALALLQETGNNQAGIAVLETKKRQLAQTKHKYAAKYNEIELEQNPAGEL